MNTMSLSEIEKELKHLEVYIEKLRKIRLEILAKMDREKKSKTPWGVICG